MHVPRRMADNFFEFAEWRTNDETPNFHAFKGVAREEMQLLPSQSGRRGKKFHSVQEALLLFLDTLTPFGFECFSHETWRLAVVLILSEYCSLGGQRSHYEGTEEGRNPYNYDFSDGDADWASCLSEETYRYFELQAKKR